MMQHKKNKNMGFLQIPNWPWEINSCRYCLSPIQLQQKAVLMSTFLTILPKEIDHSREMKPWADKVEFWPSKKHFYQMKLWTLEIWRQVQIGAIQQCTKFKTLLISNHHIHLMNLWALEIWRSKEMTCTWISNFKTELLPQNYSTWVLFYAW
jgi:hypothetical protein